MLGISWSQGLQDAWSHVAVFVPKFLAFLVILVIGYVVGADHERAPRPRGSSLLAAARNALSEVR